MEAFNAALTAFRGHLGKGYRVNLTVKSCPVRGPNGQTVRATIRKPRADMPGAAQTLGFFAPLEPATLLDIMATEDAWRLKTAEVRAGPPARAQVDTGSGAYAMAVGQGKGGR